MAAPAPPPILPLDDDMKPGEFKRYRDNLDDDGRLGYALYREENRATYDSRKPNVRWIMVREWEGLPDEEKADFIRRAKGEAEEDAEDEDAEEETPRERELRERVAALEAQLAAREVEATGSQGQNNTGR